MAKTKAADLALIRQGVAALIDVECWGMLVVSLQDELNRTLYEWSDGRGWTAGGESEQARGQLIEAVNGLRVRARTAEELIVRIEGLSIAGVADVALDSRYSMKCMDADYSPWLEQRHPGLAGLLYRPREIRKAYEERLAPVQRFRERLQVVSGSFHPLDTRAAGELSEGEWRIWSKLGDGKLHKAEKLRGPGAQTAEVVRQNVKNIREKLGKDSIISKDGKHGGYFRPDRR